MGQKIDAVSFLDQHDPADIERDLAVTRDVQRAAIAGFRLQVAVSQQGTLARLITADPARPPSRRASLVGIKLAAVHLLNRLGRHQPDLARRWEGWLKMAWWRFTRQNRSDEASRLSLPFLNRPAFQPQSVPAPISELSVPTPINEGKSVSTRVRALVPHPADRPLVSIVIPCFNYGRFVGEAVASALGQTFADIEIIVIDGGSDDGSTPDIVRGLEGARVRVVLREGRHRVGSNRNFGIAMARGRYVCCLDADDRLAATFIEKAVFLMEHYAYDVVSSSVQMFGLDQRRYGVAEAVDLESLLRGNEIATCALFRRDLWEAFGGYRDHGSGAAGEHLHEDWDFWIRLAAQGARIFNIEREHLFLYRVHGTQSLSRRRDVRPLAEQRAELAAANADVLTPEAFERSLALRDAEIDILDPDRNLLGRAGPAPAPGVRPPCLVVMLPWLVMGGAERLLSSNLRHLARRGWRIVVVTTLEPNPAFGDTTPWFEAITTEIYKLPSYLSDPRRWDAFLDYLVASRGAERLLIAGSAYAYGRLAHLRARFPRLKVFDLLFNTVGHTGNNRRHAGLIDRHLVENGEVRDWLVRHGEAVGRIEVIPSGVKLPEAEDQAGRARARAALALSDEDLLVGFSGRWSPEKNPLGFLDIAARLAANPRIRFVMTGTGEMKSEVARRVAQNPVFAERFLLLLNLDDMGAVLPAYDVLVVPSTLDGRPMVVLEALAAGVPVVASAVGGLPELVTPGLTGALCEAGDVESFVREIAALEADRDGLALQKAQARAFAQDRLDAGRMAAQFEAALG